MKKLGNIPDGGGRRYVGRAQGGKNRAATPGKPRTRHHNPRIGTAFVHTVLDDHSRVAYRSHAWRDTCAELNITPKRTGPTGRRPTARSNASTAPWPTAGRSAASS